MGGSVMGGSTVFIVTHTFAHTQLSGYDGSGYEESLDNETCAYPTSDEEAGNDEDDDGLDGDESGKT